MAVGKGKRSGEKRDFMQVAERAIGEQMSGSPLDSN
jgi:hypothetical protein